MNRGAIDTRNAFATEGLSQNDAAAAVECDSGNFSRILSGKKLPGRALAVRIAARFGVPVERWDEPATDAPPDDADEQTTPMLDRPPLGEVASEDRDSGPVSESPLDPKYPPSTPPPPPPSEEERASERPRTGSSDPFGYA
jgi:transcriptional regulator with XRE-family HTH domain